MSPDNCLQISEKLHGKLVFHDKIFVTSLVSASPKKEVIASVQTAVNDPSTPSLSEAGSTGNTSSLAAESQEISCKSDPQGSSSESSQTAVVSTESSPEKSLISPENQEKSDLFSISSEKRKAEKSPDQTGLSKKEKKKLKDIARSSKKQEEKEKKQVNLSPSK